MRHLLLFISVLLLIGQTGAAANASEPESEMEIHYLLAFVADSGCTFFRNGEDHAAPDAADHLRLKYNRGKRYVSSAEQFIDRLATESSWSGDPYSVTCKGSTQPSAQWLHQALADYRSRDLATATPPR